MFIWDHFRSSDPSAHLGTKLSCFDYCILYCVSVRADFLSFLFFCRIFSGFCPVYFIWTFRINPSSCHFFWDHLIFCFEVKFTYSKMHKPWLNSLVNACLCIYLFNSQIKVYMTITQKSFSCPLQVIISSLHHHHD